MDDAKHPFPEELQDIALAMFEQDTGVRKLER